MGAEEVLRVAAVVTFFVALFIAGWYIGEAVRRY